MNKLVVGLIFVGAVAVGIFATCFIMMDAREISDVRAKPVVQTQAASGRLQRRSRDGKSVEEIRRIARSDAKKEVARVARGKQDEAAKKRAEEQKRLSEEFRKKWEKEWNSLKPDERKLLDELNEVMCDDDLELVSSVADELAKNPNPVIRRAAVEAISWFGDKGLPDLAVFLVDSDEEVASLAKERWSLGVEEVEDDQEKVTLAKLGLLYVKDEDSLNAFMGDLTMVDDDLKIMQALVDLIEEGTPESATVAKAQYEWMTGDEYAGVDAADRWLQENYEPPESDGSEASQEDQKQEVQEQEEIE